MRLRRVLHAMRRLARRALRRLGRRRVMWLMAVMLVMAVAAWVAGPPVWGWVHPLEPIPGTDDQAQALTQRRQLALAAFAALGGAVALAYTARNYALSRRGQVTERFAKALERFDSDRMYVRIGGIQALAHVMAESADHHNDVVEILVAFLRDHAPRADHHPFDGRPPRPLPKEPAADVQAALTALARRPTRPEHQPLNLTHLHLAGAVLDGAKLAHARLDGADLAGAVLRGANLTDARLDGTDLAGALLGGADLTSAKLTGADLTRAWLGGANLRLGVLRNGNLTRASLFGANLTDADLEGAYLTSAVLSRANLTGARLGGAKLIEARLDEADLTDAQLGEWYVPWKQAAVTAKQLNTARVCASTELPDELMFDPVSGRVWERTAAPDVDGAD